MQGLAIALVVIGIYVNIQPTNLIMGSTPGLPLIALAAGIYLFA